MAKATRAKTGRKKTKRDITEGVVPTSRHLQQHHNHHYRPGGEHPFLVHGRRAGASRVRGNHPVRRSDGRTGSLQEGAGAGSEERICLHQGPRQRARVCPEGRECKRHPHHRYRVLTPIPHNGCRPPKKEGYKEEETARYTGPVCKICRREGVKLFLKGQRCYTDKCAVVTREYPRGSMDREGARQ